MINTWLIMGIYGGFHKWEIPNSWMVLQWKIREEMDDDWGGPQFKETSIWRLHMT